MLCSLSSFFIAVIFVICILTNSSLNFDFLIIYCISQLLFFTFSNVFLKFFKKFHSDFIFIELFIKLFQFIISNWLCFFVILLFLLIFSSNIFFSNFIHIIFINLCIINYNADMMKLMWLNNNLFFLYFIMLFVFVSYLIFILYMHKHSI